MERFTISIDDELAREFGALMRAKRYQNRSEAVRDMLRTELETFRLSTGAAPFCISVVSYVYNQHEWALAQKVISRLRSDHSMARRL